METTSLALSKNMDKPDNRAYALHARIRAAGELAATALLDIGGALKEMRDEKHFKFLGYDSFESYTETEFKMSKRNANRYINVFNSYGERLGSLSQIGVTKLDLLTTISEDERLGFMEQNKVEDMSAAELRKALDELKRKDEEIAKLKETASETADDAASDELEAEREQKESLQCAVNVLNDEINELRRKLETAKKANSVKDSEALEQAKQEAERLAAKKYSDELERVRAEADAARSEQERKDNEKLEHATRQQREAADKLLALEQQIKEKEAAAADAEKYKDIIESEKKRAEKLEKQIKILGNPELQKFKFKFEELQCALMDLLKCAASMPDENRKKCLSALSVLGRKMIDCTEDKQ